MKMSNLKEYSPSIVTLFVLEKKSDKRKRSVVIQNFGKK